MNESEREQLAKRLSAMSLKEARKEIYKMDRDADMKYFRNSYWDEYHTLFVLPHKELAITLVETTNVEKTDKRDYTGPADRKRLKLEYQYAEARVRELERPAHKHGGELRYQFQ